MLHLTPETLQEITNTADGRYRIAKKETKKDGTTRICYDALRPLKTIQARIQCMILNRVKFPPYLQGGIKSDETPRGQAPNAQIHLRKNTMVTEDIQRFYPSVHRSIVFDIWHGLLRFPPPVAECLTRLTTREGYLPQGAKTSTLLANLVFWDTEHRLVADLAVRDIACSRFVDDITISSNNSLQPAELSDAIASINAMIVRKGMRLKRRKQTIARPGDRKITTQLVVNAKTSLATEERSSIRAAVAQATRTPPDERGTTRYQREYRRTLGRTAYLKQHHPKEGAALLDELHHARPENGRAT